MAVCVGMLFGTVYAQTLEQEQQEEAAVQELVLPDVLEEETAQDTENTTEKQGTEEEEEHLPEDWNLILVNSTHPIPEDYQVELKNIGSGHQIDARAYDDFRAMIQAAKSEGVYIYVTSSYRDLDKQTDLYNKKVESYVTQG